MEDSIFGMLVVITAARFRGDLSMMQIVRFPFGFKLFYESHSFHLGPVLPRLCCRDARV